MSNYYLTELSACEMMLSSNTVTKVTKATIFRTPVPSFTKSDDVLVPCS